MSVPTFWLSFHVPYTCRHSGACCSSGWDIEIEYGKVPAITAAVGAGRVTAPRQWYLPAVEAPDDVAGVLALGDGRRCIFHRDPGCAIQTTLGFQAMPSACQHFPRIALIDPRGVFVTLSHYCPSAASLLFDTRVPVSIVEGPAALPTGAIPEGLDAREALPPLDTPRRLMDLERYSAWEQRAVALLTSADRPDAALDALDPGAPVPPERILVEIARDAVPAPYQWPPFVAASQQEWDGGEPVVGRYLAAHAFSSWTAYQGNGLRCTVLYLRLVLAVLRCEHARGLGLRDAVRQSDLLLRHLVDRQMIADRLSALAAR